jgi:hypothetical protein
VTIDVQIVFAEEVHVPGFLFGSHAIRSRVRLCVARQTSILDRLIGGEKQLGQNRDLVERRPG